MSIQFINPEGDKSLVLFSHWDGMELVNQATEYAKSLSERRPSILYPLDRLEVDTVIVDFISKLTNGKEIKSNYYLGATEKDGDNGDNGHHIITLYKA